MSELSKKYKRVIKNVEDNMSDKNELDYVKNQIEELVTTFNSEIKELKDAVNEIVNKQNSIEDKIQKVEKIVDSIEKDIYMDNEYDLEIVCPYCNYNFVLNPDETSDEVQCPECKNIIEIDWNGESLNDECGFDCGCCSHDCGHMEDDEPEDNEDDM